MLYQRECLGTVAQMCGGLAVPTEFAWSWSRMVEFNSERLCGPKTFIHYIRAKISDHAPARNDLVQRARGEWLLMLDTDHEFEPDLCYRMLHRLVAHKIDVLTGLYRLRGFPCTPVLYHWDGEDFRGLARVPDSPLFRVDGAGGGCLMARRTAYEKVFQELGEMPFDRIHPHSEDLSFFRRLARVGIEAWCDSRIEARHLKMTGITEKDAELAPVDEAGIDVQILAET